MLNDYAKITIISQTAKFLVFQHLTKVLFMGNQKKAVSDVELCFAGGDKEFASAFHHSHCQKEQKCHGIPNGAVNLEKSVQYLLIEKKELNLPNKSFNT